MLSEVSHSSHITLTVLYWLSTSDGLCWYLCAKTQLTRWTCGCIFPSSYEDDLSRFVWKKKRVSVEGPWQDLLALSCWRLSTVVCWQLGALTLGKTAPPCWQSPLMVMDQVWSAKKRIHPWCAEDKGFVKGRWLLTLIVLRQLQMYVKLFASLNSRVLPEPPAKIYFRWIFCRCHLLATSGEGPTQYCHSVILHQCRWLDSKDTLPLIGCWAVITTSNNDTHFKEIKESWKQGSWQWFFFFFGILFWGFFFLCFSCQCLLQECNHVVNYVSGNF